MRVIFNHNAGKKHWNAEEICALFLNHGITPAISFVRHHADIRTLALQAVHQGEKVVVAAGGDGTINAVASTLVGTESSLGILPLGTLNHFARDLGLPLETSEAVRVIAEQHVTAVDVGEVNGQTFVNNSSLGLYPAMVSEREHLQHGGLWKWTAWFVAFWKVLHRFPHITVQLQVDRASLMRTASFVFVGNNEYEIEGIKIGTRRCLDAGHLLLGVAGAMSRLELLRLGFSAVSGGLNSFKEFESFCTDELRVESKRRHLQVSFDGEVARMSTPLHYRILPGALRVIVPRPPSGNPG